LQQGYQLAVDKGDERAQQNLATALQNCDAAAPVVVPPAPTIGPTMEPTIEIMETPAS
jgi:hypothetical protein